MAESEQQHTPTPSLAQHWSLQEKEQQPVQSDAPAPLEETTEDIKPVENISSDSVEEKTAETPPANESSVAEQTDEAIEGVAEEVEEAAEEQPEIKIETAPADFRFPTTNQTRHCFTRYIEYHRCIAAKGEDASECNKFAKYYRALCPGEWVDRWNEQRENGTFPGPL